MPIYEYQCVSCGHVFELWQSFTAPAPEICPECGAGIKKIIHAPQVVFKGAGFYSSDNKKSTDKPKDKKKNKEADEKKETAAPAKPDVQSASKGNEKK